MRLSLDVLIVGEQGPDDRQSISRRQTPRGAGELAADLDVWLGPGQFVQLCREIGAETWPASPSSRTVQRRTNGSLMIESSPRYVVVETATQIQGPERFQRKLTRMLRNRRGQNRNDAAIFSVADQTQGCLALPFVLMLQQRRQARAVASLLRSNGGIGFAPLLFNR